MSFAVFRALPVRHFSRQNWGEERKKKGDDRVDGDPVAEVMEVWEQRGEGAGVGGW